MAADSSSRGYVGAPKVAQIDARERLDFLARAFDREIYDVDEWSWTWGSVYTAGVVAEGVALSVTHDRGARIDLTVGILATGFGALSLYGLPLKLTLPLRASRSHWEDDADRCADLARAERTLVGEENDQSFATGIFAHVGNVAVNAAIVLILGLGYGHWTSAALSVRALSEPAHVRRIPTKCPTEQFDWTWNPSGCHVPADASVSLPARDGAEAGEETAPVDDASSEAEASRSPAPPPTETRNRFFATPADAAAIPKKSERRSTGCDRPADVRANDRERRRIGELVTERAELRRELRAMCETGADVVNLDAERARRERER